MASSTPQSVRPETGNPTTRALGAKMTWVHLVSPQKTGGKPKLFFFANPSYSSTVTAVHEASESATGGKGPYQNLEEFSVLRPSVAP